MCISTECKSTAPPHNCVHTMAMAQVRLHNDQETMTFSITLTETRSNCLPLRYVSLISSAANIYEHSIVTCVLPLFRLWRYLYLFITFDTILAKHFCKIVSSTIPFNRANRIVRSYCSENDCEPGVFWAEAVRSKILMYIQSNHIANTMNVRFSFSNLIFYSLPLSLLQQTCLSSLFPINYQDLAGEKKWLFHGSLCSGVQWNWIFNDGKSKANERLTDYSIVSILKPISP